MAVVVSDRAVSVALRKTRVTFGEDVRRLREDAGIARADLSRASGVDPSYLARIESGTASPSFETCTRLGLALGADLAARLYPNTGPLIRDRHQAGIASSLLSMLHGSWQPFAEIAVRRPSRGWIDLGLLNRRENVIAAAEIQSELRRLEQLLRWSEEKARSLPSWEGWSRLDPEPSISRLLLVRSTRATREVARDFGRLLRTAFPGHPDDALDSLLTGSAWPGPSILWAVPDGTSGRFRMVPRA